MDGREDPCEFSLLTEKPHVLGCSRPEGEALVAPGYLARLQAGLRGGSCQVIVAALSICTRTARSQGCLVNCWASVGSVSPGGGA